MGVKHCRCSFVRKIAKGAMAVQLWAAAVCFWWTQNEVKCTSNALRLCIVTLCWICLNLLHRQCVTVGDGTTSCTCFANTATCLDIMSVNKYCTSLLCVCGEVNVLSHLSSGSGHGRQSHACSTIYWTWSVGKIPAPACSRGLYRTGCLHAHLGFNSLFLADVFDSPLVCDEDPLLCSKICTSSPALGVVMRAA